MTNYRIEIATDSNFTAMVVSQAGIAATTFTPGAPLPANTYFWRVYAVNGFGETRSTEPVWSFTTN